MTEISNNQEIEHKNWWDILSAVVFFFAIMTAATRLVATGWVRNLDLVQTVAFLGIFLGLALGKSVFSKLVSFLFGLAYGIFVIPWQLGLTLDEEIEWLDRLGIMVERLRVIVLELIVREDVTDNLFFLLVMAVLFWILSVYCGYQLVRYGDVWRALLPGGLAVFIIHSYDPLLSRRTWYLAFYIFLFLLLLARNYFIKQHRRWQKARTYVPPDAGFDFVRFTLLVSIVIVLTAWNSPALANTISPISNIYHAIERPWQDAKERLSYLFASLRATVGLVSDYYADEQPLGRGNVNSDSLVMRIVAPRVDFPGQRYYWKARTYDTYDNGIWATTVEEEIEFNPNSGDLDIPAGGERITVDVEITPRTSLITLFSPAQPLWFSQSGSINYILTEEGAFDIVNMKASPFVHPDNTYTARASIPEATEKELREAGVDYPQWVLDRYLQIPEDITPRTRLLAERLAEGRDNPYDIAATMTVWLRENMEYTEVIDSPPGNQEPIDWFLFDYQQGFCNYYSSSMVIMLRSLGIPARWAVGYAQGNQIGGQASGLPDQLREQVPELFLEDEKTFVVRQLDAHAWPEVYFPGIGWIEFEPTVSQIAIFRPSGEDLLAGRNENPLGGNTQPEDLPVPDDFANLDEEITEQTQEQDRTGVIILSVVSGLVGLAIILMVIFYRRNPYRLRSWWDQVMTEVRTPIPIQLEFGFHRIGLRPPGFLRRLSYQAQLPLAAKSFLEVNKANDRLGLVTPASFTPSERTAVLARKIPDLEKYTSELLLEYQKETYSTANPDEYIAKRAGSKIRQRSMQVWLEMIQDRIKLPFLRVMRRR